MYNNLGCIFLCGDEKILKQPTGSPSPSSMLKLISKIEQIETVGILDIDISWLHNNFQRALTRYTKKCDAKRLRELENNHRYAVLVCFLWQVYMLKI